MKGMGGQQCFGIKAAGRREGKSVLSQLYLVRSFDPGLSKTRLLSCIFLEVFQQGAENLLNTLLSHSSKLKIKEEKKKIGP